MSARVFYVECVAYFSLTVGLGRYNIEKDIAAYIKKEFDKKYNPTWHCIVGRNFGASEFSQHTLQLVGTPLLTRSVFFLQAHTSHTRRSTSSTSTLARCVLD